MGDPDIISPWSLASENYSPGAIVRHYLRDPIFSRFNTILECDTQTDRQTDDDGIYRASIASRGKNRQIRGGVRLTEWRRKLVPKVRWSVSRKASLVPLPPRFTVLPGESTLCLSFLLLLAFLWLGPIYWAIAVPSVTRCRCCRCGHRFYIAIGVDSSDTWWMAM